MIRKLLASLLASIVLVGVFGSMAGCSTVEGIGNDLQAGGRAIKNEVNERR